MLLKGQCHEILWSFQIYSKIREEICKSRCTTGINNTSGKFATSTASVVDTGGNFATGVNDTAGGKLNLKKKICLYVDSTIQKK
jgi:hypothetical protein